MSRFDKYRKHQGLSSYHATQVTWAGAIVVLCGALIAFYLHLVVISKTLGLVDTLTKDAEALFSDVPELADNEANLLRTHLNKTHVETAKAQGYANLTQQTVRAKLVQLQDNAYFQLRPMEYSMPYVTQSTAHLLELIGVRFQEALREQGLPPYRYVITSATRTSENQAALRKVNGNAAATSSHEFGTTVDIHYNDFWYAPTQDSLPSPSGISTSLLADRMETVYANLGELNSERLGAILGRTLIQLQREGKVLVIYERRQPVYHITVATRVSTPVLEEPLLMGP